MLEHRAKKKQSERASQEGGELNQDDDTNEELAQKNDELEAELAEREARISELEEEVADLTAHTTELQDKNSTLKDKNSALKDKKLKLKDDNSRANEENEELNDTVLKLRERKKQLKTEKARANEENEELKAKVAELTDEVLKLKERKKELKKENTKANAEIVELNTELNKRLSMTSTPFRLPSSQNLDMDDDADGQEEAAQLVSRLTPIPLTLLTKPPCVYSPDRRSASVRPRSPRSIARRGSARRRRVESRSRIDYAAAWMESEESSGLRVFSRLASSTLPFCGSRHNGSSTLSAYIHGVPSTTYLAFAHRVISCKIHIGENGIQMGSVQGLTAPRSSHQVNRAQILLT